jgi:hypothetical protein
VTDVTEAIVDAACDALTWMVEEGYAAGMPLEHIWAHRQSNKNRRADPGEELWKRVVLGYAVPVLGLRVQNVRRLQSKSRKSRGWGRRIPHQWDEAHGLGEY